MIPCPPLHCHNTTVETYEKDATGPGILGVVALLGRRVATKTESLLLLTTLLLVALSHLVGKHPFHACRSFSQKSSKTLSPTGQWRRGGPMRGSKAAESLTVVLMSLLLLALPAQAGPVEDAGPLPPWALTAETLDAEVHLAWNPPEGLVDGYNVYRADNLQTVALEGLAAFSLIGQTSTPSFLDIPSEGGAGIYMVTATYDTRESLPSNPAGYPYCLDLFPSCFLPPPMGP